jgi:hypothetical protein
MAVGDRPVPPTSSPVHRVEQISFEVRRIMAEIDRHEKRIRELQVEVQALVTVVKGYMR